MNGSCTTCGMTGGSIEFFDQYALLSQQENKQKNDKDFCNTCVGGKNENGGNPFDGANFANSLACTNIKCQKAYLGCVYSAQGSVVCNLPQEKEKEKKDIKEHFVPGVMLGGLPNFSPLPFTSSENNHITKYLY